MLDKLRYVTPKPSELNTIPLPVHEMPFVDVPIVLELPLPTTTHLLALHATQFPYDTTC